MLELTQAVAAALNEDEQALMERTGAIGRILQDLERNPHAALILDLAGDPETSLKALEKVKQAAPDLYVMASNYHADGETVIGALRSGANDFLMQGRDREIWR